MRFPVRGGMALHALEDMIILPYDDEESVERLLSRHRDELACVILDPKAGIIPIRHDFYPAGCVRLPRNSAFC